MTQPAHLPPINITAHWFNTYNVFRNLEWDKSRWYKVKWEEGAIEILICLDILKTKNGNEKKWYKSIHSSESIILAI